MTTTGSCACHQIEFQYSGNPVLTALCHCVDCQKWTGSAYTSNAVVRRDSFKVTKGTPKIWDIAGDTGKNNRHFFCSACGSSLYSEPEAMPDKTLVKAGTLDKGAASLGGKIDIELYTKDRVGYMTAMRGAKQEAAFVN
ncbi:uncharacterized protein G6M90_00g080610 [Metarhizium brunneum]|uniref:CENP-V/GFA domain-containing protein n=1 Tax=Metarhizium brunneum TaxID=500148 RepID=A0A7D5UZL7_9HYPO